MTTVVAIPPVVEDLLAQFEDMFPNEVEQLSQYRLEWLQNDPMTRYRRDGEPKGSHQIVKEKNDEFSAYVRWHQKHQYPQCAS